MPCLSVKVIDLRSVQKFHPEVLYSTDLQSFCNLGNPFLPGIFFLQLSSNREIAAHVRSVALCLAIECSRSAKSNSMAKTLVYLLRSKQDVAFPSIPRRRHLFRINCIVRIASSMALNWAVLPYAWNSKTIISFSWDILQ